MQLKNSIQRLTIFLFLFTIAMFGLLHILTPQQSFSTYENRYLKTMPTLSSPFNKDYLKEIEESFNDQFPLRNMLVSMHALQNKMLLQATTNDVYLGKRNQLIPHVPYVDTAIYQTNLTYIQQFMKRNPIPMSCILIPSKHTILQEDLPLFHYDIDEYHLWKTMQQTLPEMNMIDLFTSFQKNHQEALYYTSDHHLTSYGSYQTYLAYLDQKGYTSQAQITPKLVAHDFKGSLYVKTNAFWYSGDAIYTYTDPSVLVEYEENGEWIPSLYQPAHLTKRDKYPYFLDGNHAIVKIHNPKAPKRHVLILRDSFAQSFAPFIANDASDITLIDLRYYKKNITTYIQEHAVDEVMFYYSMDTVLTQKDIRFLR